MQINREIARYLCHKDGDHYLDKISEEDAKVLNQIVEIEEVEHTITKTVQSLNCKLNNGQKIKVRLFTNPNHDFVHFTDFKIIYL